MVLSVIVSNIVASMVDVPGVSIEAVGRDANRVTDWLVKGALLRMRSMDWVNQPPSSLRILVVDADFEAFGDD